jgi:hypothetical protein
VIAEQELEQALDNDRKWTHVSHAEWSDLGVFVVLSQAVSALGMYKTLRLGNLNFQCGLWWTNR